MIAILADDYTGAAEVAGVGHRYGLAAEVQTRRQPSQAGLVVVDTDSRGLHEAAAAHLVGQIACRAIAARPEWLFKKVDSVLRGPVAAELAAVLAAAGLDRALLVAGNPHSGRLIEGGRYTIAGVPLAQTEFAHDPECPAHSSRVLDLLGQSDLPLTCKAPEDGLAAAGLTVGDVRSAADLAAWANQVDPTVLPAGGAAFFDALLQAKGYRALDSAAFPPPPGPRLLVSGSASAGSQALLAKLEAAGTPVARMPIGLLAGDDPALLESWAGAVKPDRRGLAVLAIGLEQRPATPELVARLCRCAARATALALQRQPAGHLLIEGGATASTVLRELGYSRLSVLCEHSQGVVTMRPAAPRAPLVTTKPGSYPWPAAIAALWGGNAHV